MRRAVEARVISKRITPEGKGPQDYLTR